MKSPNVSTDQEVHTSTTRRRYYDAGKTVPSKTYTRTMDGGTGFYRNTEPGAQPQGPKQYAPSDAFGKFLGSAAQIAGAASSLSGAFPSKTGTIGKPKATIAPTTTAAVPMPVAKKGLNIKNKDMKKTVVAKGKYANGGKSVKPVAKPSDDTMDKFSKGGKSVKMVKTYGGGTSGVTKSQTDFEQKEKSNKKQRDQENEPLQQKRYDLLNKKTISLGSLKEDSDITKIAKTYKEEESNEINSRLRTYANSGRKDIDDKTREAAAKSRNARLKLKTYGGGSGKVDVKPAKNLKEYNEKERKNIDEEENKEMSAATKDYDQARKNQNKDNSEDSAAIATLPNSPSPVKKFLKSSSSERLVEKQAKLRTTLQKRYDAAGAKSVEAREYNYTLSGRKAADDKASAESAKARASRLKLKSKK